MFKSFKKLLRQTKYDRTRPFPPHGTHCTAESRGEMWPAMAAEDGIARASLRRVSRRGNLWAQPFAHLITLFLLPSAFSVSLTMHNHQYPTPQSLFALYRGPPDDSSHSTHFWKMKLNKSNSADSAMGRFFSRGRWTATVGMWSLLRSQCCN